MHIQFIDLILSLDWEARVRTSPWNHLGIIPSAPLDVRREGAGLVHLEEEEEEEQMKEERKAQWMASLQGPGWARRGRCHGL